MKNKQLNRFLSVVMTLVVTAILFSSVMAQSSVKGSTKLERERMSRIMDPNTSVEEFRAEMKNYLTDLGNALSNFQAIPAVRNQYAKNGFDPVNAVERAKADFDKIPAEDLMKMREVYAKYPEWREAPRAIYEITQKVSNRTYTKAAADKNSGSMTINVIITDSCPDISATPSYADIAVTKTAESVAQGIMDALPTDALTVAAHAAASGVLTGLRAATLATETLRSQYEDCSRASFETAIQNQVTTSTTNIINNDNTNKTAIISNDNTNKDTIVLNDNNNKDKIVANDNTNRDLIIAEILKSKATIIADAHGNKDELKNLLLRTQIEADLSSTDGSAFVALYETPKSVCFSSLDEKGLAQSLTLPGEAPVPVIQCGLLDLVREIVRQTIANVGAGTNAQSFFNSAVAQQAAGKYKAAYASYRQAYKAAGK